MQTKRAAPRTRYADLQFWMNSAVDARTAIQAATMNYGSTAAQDAAIETLSVVISEYRHRMHDLTEEMRA
jgi:hypothetical protein